MGLRNIPCSVGLSFISICGITSITKESNFDWSLCILFIYLFKKLNCGYNNARKIQINRANVLEVLA